MNNDQIRDAKALLPMARSMLDGKPTTSASDGAPQQFALAMANAELLSPGWCLCPARADVDTAILEQAYFARLDGGHGWLCTRCRKITQTG